MADKAHRETDQLISELEEKIGAVYGRAAKETQEKLDAYLSAFDRKIRAKKDDLDSGKITKAEYDRWVTGQVMIGKRWKELVDSLSKDLANADKIAQSMTQGYMAQAYAINHDYATFEVEHDSLVNTSYTLYDRHTAERLIKDEPSLLPKPSEKTEQEIREGKLIRWNAQKITGEVTQGILQGESVSQIARRMQTVAQMDDSASVRNARTAVTGAQNAGRQAGYERAVDMGIKTEKQWLATMDARTRHEHVVLDGQHVPVDENFKVGPYEIEYPGDPTAEPEMVYNCRCTMICRIKGFEKDFTDRQNPALGDMTYDDWKRIHEEAVAKNAEKAEKEQDNTFASSIEYSDTLMKPKYDEVRETINNLVNEYDTRLKSVSAGAEKAAGDVNITGEKMRINTTNLNTVIHEFAHTLANTDADKYGLTNDKEFWKEIKSVRRKYMEDVQYDSSRWISSYEHSHKKLDEFLAEAFTQAKMAEIGLPLPDKYGNDLTYSQQVLEIIDNYFKRKKH